MTDTARLLALLEAATPRPWWPCIYGHILALGSTTNVASTWTTPDDNYPEGRPWKANAELIAEAVNALPGLIAEVERLRAEVKRWYDGVGVVGDQGIQWMEKAKALEETIHEIQRDRLQETALLEWVAEELGCEEGDITESLRKQTVENERLRSALLDAGLSLASYEQSCGQGSGMNEAADIARLLGWEGGSDENMKDWYVKALNAKG